MLIPENLSEFSCFALLNDEAPKVILQLERARALTRSLEFDSLTSEFVVIRFDLSMLLLLLDNELTRTFTSSSKSKCWPGGIGCANATQMQAFWGRNEPKSSREERERWSEEKKEGERQESEKRRHSELAFRSLACDLSHRWRFAREACKIAGQLWIWLAALGG